MRAPKDACGTRSRRALKRAGKVVVELLGEFRICGIAKLGRLPLRVSAISVNWLTTSSAGCVEERPVEAPGLVLEDPKTCDLASQPFRLRQACP